MQANTLPALADVKTRLTRDDIDPSRDTSSRGGDALYTASGPNSTHATTWLSLHTGGVPDFGSGKSGIRPFFGNPAKSGSGQVWLQPIF